MLCIGGGDGTTPSADVFLIHWKNGGVHFEKLHDLPQAMAGCSAAVIGDRVYVAGGSRGFDAAAQASEHVFYSLELADPKADWKTLEAWPGPERFYTVMAAAGDDTVYVMSGMQRTRDDAGKAKLVCLSDVYRYDTKKSSWTKLADLPRAHAAAPTPASVVGDRWILLLGGGVDDEALARPMNQRADFPHTITSYDLRAQTAAVIGSVSESPVATNQVRWGDEIIVPSGEVRSGVRSPQVWAYRW
jgi:N-acetylneuraminic acid mutarotase